MQTEQPKDDSKDKDKDPSGEEIPADQIVNPDVEAREGKFYAKLEEGEIVQVSSLPESGVLADGSHVSGFDKLDDATLKDAGWVPVEDPGEPKHNPEQNFVSKSFETDGETVTAVYEVTPVPDPAQEPASPQDRFDQLVDILVSKGMVTAAQAEEIKSPKPVEEEKS